MQKTEVLKISLKNLFFSIPAILSLPLETAHIQCQNIVYQFYISKKPIGNNSTTKSPLQQSKAISSQASPSGVDCFFAAHIKMNF